MDENTMKGKLRATREYKPQDETLLDIAVSEAIQFVWDAHDWSYKKDVDTFSTSSGTYKLPTKVDSILELTHSPNNQVVSPLPSYRVAENYDNVSRIGTNNVYYFSLYSADADAITLELTPTPGSGVTFTYRYNKKIDYGDLSAIPEKHHSLVFTGARMFLARGIIEHWPALEDAIQRDKPVRHTRWAMGQNAAHVNRVNRYNSVMQGGSNQDTTRPID